MRLTDNHPDWHELYQTEIETANNELIEKNFRINEQSVICDIYSLPSHNHQTFYGKVVSERGLYKIVYAKAIQHSMWFSDPIFMYTFEEAKRFEEHPMKRGKIICRARLLEKDFINSILFTLWRLGEKQPDDAVVPSAEADFTAITLYEKGKLAKRIFYTDAALLAFRSSSDNSRAVEFLNNLHLLVEELIGVGE